MERNPPEHTHVEPYFNAFPSFVCIHPSRSTVFVMCQPSAGCIDIHWGGRFRPIWHAICYRSRPIVVHDILITTVLRRCTRHAFFFWAAHPYRAFFHLLVTHGRQFHLSFSSLCSNIFLCTARAGDANSAASASPRSSRDATTSCACRHIPGCQQARRRHLFLRGQRSFSSLIMMPPL